MVTDAPEQLDTPMTEDAPVRRRRGRKPADLPLDTLQGETAQDGAPAQGKKDSTPRRRGKARITAKDVAEIKGALTTVLVLADGAAAQFAPTYWTDADRLQDGETAALVEAVYAELELWPTALLWLQRGITSSVHVRLGLTVLAIAVPRLVNHGVLPPGFMLVAMAFMGQAGAAPVPQPAPTNGVMYPDGTTVFAGAIPGAASGTVGPG